MKMMACNTNDGNAQCNTEVRLSHDNGLIRCLKSLIYNIRLLI